MRLMNVIKFSVPRISTPVVRVAAMVSLALVVGCAEMPHRPYVQAVSATVQAACNAPAIPDTIDVKDITPEVPDSTSYRLHFIEFDDQGWPHQSKRHGSSKIPNAEFQVDCAIADLASTLESENVRAFVYVHGWHHSAAHDDRDLNRFRELLTEEARRGNPSSPRRVIGFYVGWNGNTVPAPLLKHLTFWGRKNAAHHVSEGTAREFFARIKALRDYWNQPTHKGRSENCGSDRAGMPCPLRTIMIGHSFGAWILFSATSPYILETLSGVSDLPKDVQNAISERERSIADLVVLLNPAFEGSRYEPVFRASQRYRGHWYQPPLLVSVTSTADGATKTAFPIARFFNSIFQYPATSEAESEAMKHTHGHIERYLTHDLTADPLRTSKDKNSRMTCVLRDGSESDPQTLRTRFYSSGLTPDGSLQLEPRWTREMCGGLTLRSLGNPTVPSDGIVWNIRTFKEVIPDHNSITTLPLLNFVQQLYGDVGATPRLKIAR